MNDRRGWRIGICLAAALCIAGGQAGQAQNARERARYVWTEKEALVAHAPELIAAPNVLGAKWSPNGRRLVVVRQSPTSEPPDLQSLPTLSVLLWNSGSRRAYEVWRHPLALRSLRLADALQWMSNGEVVVIVLAWEESMTRVGPDGATKEIVEERQGALFVDAVQGQARIVALAPQDTIVVSPTEAVVAHYEQDQKQLHFLSADGTVKKTMTLPASLPYAFLGWSEDGRQLVVKWTERSADQKSRERKWLVVNPKTGETVAAEKEPVTYRAPALPPTLLTARRTMQAIKEGDSSQTVHPLWLECSFKSDKTRMLITPD